MRVVVDHGKCQGHGRCYDLSPEVFGADDDGYVLLNIDGDIPAGLDASRVALAAHSLHAKRARAVAKTWSVLKTSLADRFAPGLGDGAGALNVQKMRGKSNARSSPWA